MGDFLWWIVIGLIAGGLGKLIMPGKDPGGCFVTILLGIAGALLAGYVSQVIGLSEPGEQAGFWKSIVSATIGAIALLALYRVILKVRNKG